MSDSPRGLDMEPVSLLPSALNVKVTSMVLPCRPGMEAVHLPSTSAAKADVTIRQASVATEAKNAVILMQSMMRMAIEMLLTRSLKGVQPTRNATIYERYATSRGAFYKTLR